MIRIGRVTMPVAKVSYHNGGKWQTRRVRENGKTVDAQFVLVGGRLDMMGAFTHLSWRRVK